MSTVTFPAGPYQIQVRQGLAIDLPGQPLTGLDTIPQGLNPGELALAVDTGDVFIGSNTSYQLFDNARLNSYPYSNIRILTESDASIQFIQTVISQTQTQLNSVVLSASTTAPVGTTDLVWNTTQTNVAQIQYMLCFENVPTAVRNGKVSVTMNQSEASVLDERVDVGFDYFDYTDPNAYENFSAFEFSVSVTNGVATLQYANNSSFNARLYYSVVTFKAIF
jgi:hypothetical protein